MIFRCVLLLVFSFLVQLDAKPFIIGILHNQLGNQMFEVAATYSLALDNGAEALFPDLANKQSFGIQKNRKFIFWKLNAANPAASPEFTFSYHEIPYVPIPYRPNMLLSGLFHSEKFFAHHKKEIIDLYQPHPSIAGYLQTKYKKIIQHPKSVAVHVRCYWPYHKSGYPDGKDVLPFLGFEWFKKAIKQFPKDYLFVVFSDNIPLCKANLFSSKRNIIFIENEPYYHDLYLMSMCKHNIISNSSFSWWGAYLNQNPKKRVLAPKVWFDPSCGFDGRDIIPEGWTIVE